MSVQAITWAISVSTGKVGKKCLLITLANYADERGQCWPSQERLARDTDQSVDTVQRRLAELEKDGLITRQRRSRVTGQRASDLYTLRMGKEPKPQSAMWALDDGGNGGDQNRTTPEPKPRLCGLEIEPSLEPSGSPPTPPRQPMAPSSGRTTGPIGALPTDGHHRADRGRTETEIAHKIGPTVTDGYLILCGLAEHDIDQLCAMHRRGALTGDHFARLRAGEGFR
jgi:hypothetical protein